MHLGIMTNGLKATALCLWYLDSRLRPLNIIFCIKEMNSILVEKNEA